MKIGILDILYFLTLFQLLFFSFFLLSLKKGKRLSNLLLAIFLLSKLFAMINHLFSRFEINNPHIHFVLLPFIFLYGPSLYSYVRSLAYRDFTIKTRHLFHLIPFILANIYFTVIYHTQSTARKVEILSNMRDPSHPGHNYYDPYSHHHIYLLVRFLPHPFELQKETEKHFLQHGKNQPLLA